MADPSKPNILLITTDSQRTDTLRCMGSPFAHSPNIDRLAREGVLFAEAYTASPACMPARCSLLSGLHTPLHGCLENGVKRYADMPFFTDLLQDAGYRNIMVGKTHFGPIPASFAVRETVRGEKGSERNDDFTRYFQANGYCEASRYPNQVPEEYCLDSLIVDRALHHMENARQEGVPFFAFCSILSPHSPMDPPGRWEGFYRPEDIPAARFRKGEWRELPTSLQRTCGLLSPQTTEGFLGRMREAVGNTPDEADPMEIRRYKALYYGSAAYCDALVGRLIDHLDRSGLRENTLVVFTSDHGQQLFDHGFNDKHTYYDESWRVPLILSLPGRLPCGQTRSFACGTDIAPTILASAGLSFDGANGFDLFTPLCQGKELPRRHAAGSIQRSIALVTENWKLEHYMDDQATRLFDRRNDRHEARECANDPSLASIRQALLEALLIWRAEMVNTADLRARLTSGGPVATRATSMFRELTGDQCEVRLDEAARRIDAQTR